MAIHDIFAASTPHVTQLPFAQEPLSLILFHFRPLVIASSALHKRHHFSGCSPPFHAHRCSPWGQSLRPTVPFHLLLYCLLWCCLFLSASFVLLGTFSLLVFLSSTSKTLYYFSYCFLSSHFFHSTLHYPTHQGLESVYRLLLFFYPSSLVPTVLGQVAKPLALPTLPAFSSF